MGSTIFHGFGFGMANPDEFRPVAITTQEDLINAENMCIAGGIGTTQVNRTDRMIGTSDLQQQGPVQIFTRCHIEYFYTYMEY